MRGTNSITKRRSQYPKKAETRRLTYLLEKAKRKLVGSLQKELQYQVDLANVKKDIRKDTIGQLL